MLFLQVCVVRLSTNMQRKKDCLCIMVHGALNWTESAPVYGLNLSVFYNTAMRICTPCPSTAILYMYRIYTCSFFLAHALFCSSSIIYDADALKPSNSTAHKTSLAYQAIEVNHFMRREWEYHFIWHGARVRSHENSQNIAGMRHGERLKVAAHTQWIRFFILPRPRLAFVQPRALPLHRHRTSS